MAGGDNLDFYSGNDDLTIPMMSCGAKGVISVASNLIPGVMHEITKLCKCDDYRKAITLHKKYINLMSAMFCEPNPIPVKYACSRLFSIYNSLRLPLTEISEDNKIKIDKLLNEHLNI